MLPYGYAIINNGSTAGTLVRYTSTNGIVPLNLATDYVNNADQPLFRITSQPTTNFRIAADRNTLGATNNSPTMNAVLIEAGSGAPLGGAIPGSGTITLTSGVIATSLIGGSTQPTMIGTVVQKGLTFGAATGYLHAQANTVFSGPLIGANGFVKAGGGTLTLVGVNAVLNGGFSINAGTVNISQDASLGAAGGGVTLTGGTGGVLNFAPNSVFETSIPTTLTTSRIVTLPGAGGGVSVAAVNTTLNLAGSVTGNGRLFKTGPGTLTLTGSNNTTGEWVTSPEPSSLPRTLHSETPTMLSSFRAIAPRPPLCWR